MQRFCDVAPKSKLSLPIIGCRYLAIALPVERYRNRSYKDRLCLFGTVTAAAPLMHMLLMLIRPRTKPTSIWSPTHSSPPLHEPVRYLFPPRRTNTIHNCKKQGRQFFNAPLSSTRNIRELGSVLHAVCGGFRLCWS